MTAVRAPFAFTSDVFDDRFVTLAKQAGCGALALQLGAAPGTAAKLVEDNGLQVIGWGACSSPPITRESLDLYKPAVWMPQAETTAEFDALIACLLAGVGSGLPIEPVMTAGGMETEKPNATDSEKAAERRRRSDLLASFGVTKVWVEVYKQDADRSGQWQLGNVDWMVDFFERHLHFKEAHPVLGLWTVDASEAWAQNPYRVGDYQLDAHGRTFGAWRAEQMADERYPEIAAVPPLDIGDLMEKIGFQDGLTAFAKWLKEQPGVPARGPLYDPANVSTWPWPERLERTLRMLKDDHDARAER